MIYADQRWIAKGGIGRFARNVLAAIDHSPVSVSSDPASPLDSWKLARGLRELTPRDLFFSPGYNSPLFCASPFVFTIHDLNHLDREENSSRSKRLYYATVLKRACYRAAKILTVSDFSRRRIVEWSGVAPDKVLNVRNGVDPEFNPEVIPFAFPFPYILCVSNRKQHKNELRTIEAFARVQATRGVHLVFTGDPTPEIAKCIQRHHVSRNVHFVGHVVDKELPSLYRGAEALVFVSLYEGFGLPVLEAMACGTPVVTANTSALPEIAGDAALLVDPTSVDEIAAALERIMTDKALHSHLSKLGVAQASRFRWASTTARIRVVLSECA